MSKNLIQSEKIERERRFYLALRAGLPVLILSGLIGYNMVFKPTLIETVTVNIYLLLAILFVGIYFIYFMIELASSDVMIDNNTKFFTEKAFVAEVEKYKPDFMSMLVIENLNTIEEQNGLVAREKIISKIAIEINDFISNNISKQYIIGRIDNNELIIAFKESSKLTISKTLKQFAKKYHNIDNIDIKYTASTTEYHNSYDKTLMYLKILMQISDSSNKTQDDNTNKTLDINKLDIDTVSNNTIEALEDKNLVFTYRPMLNLSNDKVEIYEVFAKLKANDQSEILPKMYLPILNRLGLSKEYDSAIIKHIIQVLSNTDSISLAFNVSPFSIRDKSFQKQFIKMIQAAQIDPSRLIIQLYENKAHHDISSYLKLLEAYRKEGIRICIDNFGLSAASIEYIKHFKFDMIQLDRDFLTDILSSKSNKILNAILETSRSIGVLSVAKWVDKPEQKSALVDIGIDYIQGYMVHKPLFERELIQKHSKENR